MSQPPNSGWGAPQQGHGQQGQGRPPQQPYGPPPGQGQPPQGYGPQQPQNWPPQGQGTQQPENWPPQGQGQPPQGRPPQGYGPQQVYQQQHGFSRPQEFTGQSSRGKPNRSLLLVGGGLLAVALIGLVIWLIVGQKPDEPTTQPTITATTPAPPTETADPPPSPVPSPTETETKEASPQPTPTSDTGAGDQALGLGLTYTLPDGWSVRQASGTQNSVLLTNSSGQVMFLQAVSVDPAMTGAEAVSRVQQNIAKEMTGAEVSTPKPVDVHESLSVAQGYLTGSVTDSQGSFEVGYDTVASVRKSDGTMFLVNFGSEPSKITDAAGRDYSRVINSLIASQLS